MDQILTPNEESIAGKDDSERIQNTIAEAEKNGSRKIRIPRYNAKAGCNEWRIARSIKIPDHFTVILDNCYMVMENGVFDHMFTNSLSEEDISRKPEGEQKDISIIGKGNVTLDGGKHNGLLEKTSCRFGLPEVWRNTMFYWQNLDGLRVENLRIRNQRWWAMTHLFCQNVILRNLNFYAIPHVPNMDGIDLRAGCHHFLIENITGRTGDDVLALTALNGRHETASHVEGRDGDIHDITIRNIKGDPYQCYCVRLLNHDGNQIYNIDIDTIMDASDYKTKRRSGAALSIGAPLYFSRRKAQPGETRNISVKNITARSSNAILFNCTCEDTKISNVKTFGDNLNGIGTLGSGCRLHNVEIDHYWYGAKQQEICCSKALDPKNYIGTAINFPRMTGDVKIRDAHIGEVQTAIRATGGISVSIDGLTAGNYGTKLAKDNQSKVIIDGEEQ